MVQSSANRPPRANEHPAAHAARHGWLVSPTHDLLFFANTAWVLAGLALVVPGTSLPRIEFWQIYFLTTPHRWLTLVLVATDPDRRAGRGALLAVIGFVIVLVTLVATTTAVPLLCLLVVDYLWNAWHFGAQHAGMVRMYGRKLGDVRSWLETWSVRALVVYTSVRLAGWSTGWSESASWAPAAWLSLDALFLCPTLLVLALELWRVTADRLGKVVYLVSVTGLYTSLLGSVALARPALTIALATAASVFHAVEYLALVTYYAGQRRERGSAGLFRTMACQWMLLSVSYVLALGVIGIWLDQWAREAWLAVNLAVAFMHYAYDGLIWKLRAPATAQTLGLSDCASEQSLRHHSISVDAGRESRALEP